jgi:hypothetical protein
MTIHWKALEYGTITFLVHPFWGGGNNFLNFSQRNLSRFKELTRSTSRLEQTISYAQWNQKLIRRAYGFLVKLMQKEVIWQ